MVEKSPRAKRGTPPPRRGKRAVVEEAAPDDDRPGRPSQPGAARRLLQAGVKALGDVQGDVLARQQRIFEVLLGIGQSPGWPKTEASAGQEPVADPFGKFEHVFDERVARSLARLGMPTPQELRALRDKVDELADLLQRLEGGRRRKP